MKIRKVMYIEDDIMKYMSVVRFLKQLGIDTPVIFCSSQNWKIPGAVGNIFYNERRDWELEARELFQKVSRL